MEKLDGGDLFTAIRSIGILNEEQILFFSASIVLAVEYIHSRGVIYRDLKPENIMLDGDGFVKVVDFGACTKKTRSYTFIGTPEYLPPEVVLGNAYGKAVDWWSTGVIMYEMICGPLPFGENSTDPMETFKEVLEKDLHVPAKVPVEASDVLQSLLERVPEQRLGSSSFHSKNEVRAHPFFDGLQWDAILERSTLPPFQPPVELEDGAEDPGVAGEPAFSDADEIVSQSVSSVSSRWAAFDV
jgi:cGMP-dependent protein kinase